MPSGRLHILTNLTPKSESLLCCSLTVSNVTAGMDNNRYRCVVSNGCPSNVTSTGAILTVTTVSIAPVLVTFEGQPLLTTQR